MTSAKQTENTTDRGGSNRRQVLHGVAAVGGALVAGSVLHGCGSKEAKPSPAPSASAGTAIGKAADVPVGGGKVYGDLKLVVTQPKAGEFKGFSAVCTHQGCIVSSIEDRKIHCACHGSNFAVTDGSVVNGPASAPLPPIEIADDNGTLTFT